MTSPSMTVSPEKRVADELLAKIAKGGNGPIFTRSEAISVAVELSTLRAQNASLTAETRSAPETGWLIELRGQSPQWWSMTGGEGGYFTADSLKALRFARKQDADAVIDESGWTEAFASEHEWSDPRAERTHDQP